jgi:hypothetical protein
MSKLVVAILLFLFTIETLADEKSREKAKFDIISAIEVLVNIDECRNALKVEAGSLPRACNSLPYLSKYFFDPKKDLSSINEYLDSEEARLNQDALKVAHNYNITRLGKMTLSSKCVKNREPLDLDIYLNKIRGIAMQETPAKDVSESPIVEPRIPAREVKSLSK